MNLLGAANYDPSVAVSKSTASLLAMTALDTTNLRVTVTVPAHGFLRFVLRGTITGATTFPQILLGVMVGAAVKGRATPRWVPAAALATSQINVEAEFTVTGLAAGSTSFDAAYAVQVVVASTNIKYGGPNDSSGADAWGAFTFEVWDPQPLPTAAPASSGGLPTVGTGASQIDLDASGRVNVGKWLGTAVTAATAGIPDTNAKNINNVSTSSVTTINANQGTTQPINFTGTGASALAKSDVIDWNSTAVATPNTAGVPVVDTRRLVRQGTAQTSGSNSTTAIVLDAGASATNGYYKGMMIQVISGTGAPQVGVCTAYTGSSKLATISPAWPTAPDNTSVFQIFPAMVDIETIGQVAISTATAQLGVNVVNWNAQAVSVDSNNSPNVSAKYLAGTALTGRDIGASVLLSAGTGAGQLDFTSGVVKANATQWLGGTIPAVNVTGVPLVDLKYVGGTAQTAGDLYGAITAAVITGAPLNQTASAETLTTGTDTGGLANTADLDGTYDTWTAVGNTIDGYYQFDISGTTGGTAVSVTWEGFLAGAVNSLKVYYYNWAGAAWKQIGTLVGISGTEVGSQDFDLPPGATGTGGNVGLVRVRFQNTGLVAGVLNTDRILLGYAQVLSPPANWSSLAITAGGIVQSDLQTIKTQAVTCSGGVTVPAATLASTTNITAGTVTTTTNLTNAPTAGDFTAAMKTSLNAATPASVTGAVGSVTGNVGGNVVGSVGSVVGAVGSVTAGVTVTTNNDKTGYSLAANQHVIVDSGTVTTLTNLPSIPANWLTSAGIATNALNGKGDWLLASSYTAPPTTAAIATQLWTDLTSGSDFSTAGSIGALLKADINAAIGGIPTNPLLTSDARLNHLDADISSRSTYAGGDTAGTTTLLGRLTTTRATNLDNLDVASSTLATAVNLTEANADLDELLSGVGAIPTTPLLTSDTRLNHLDADVSSRSTYAGADTPGTTTLLGRVPANIFTGITRLAYWLMAGFRKEADATTVAEINAVNAANNVGTYDPTTDSLDAIRERGDVAWATGGSSDTPGTTTLLARIGTPASGSLCQEVEAIVGSAGAGAKQVTLTIQLANNVPQAQCGVWVSTDQDGTNVIAGTLYTNDSGQVTFMLNVGTYWVWRNKAGINFTNPQQLVVT